MIAGAIAALRPSERLTGLVLTGLLALTVLARPQGGGLRALTFAGLLLAVLLLDRVKGKRGAVLRDFLPILVVLLVFLLLQPLVVAVNSHRWDTALAAADGRWFGPLAEAWRGAFGRPSAFTDLVYLAYASFYFLPITVAMLAWFRLGPEGFERVAFRILLGFYLSFLGYFLWPAEGPRVPEAVAAAQLGGGAISQAVRAFLHGAEATTLDAFPSGHTVLSVLPAILATRPFPRLAPLLWAWALAIVFATVYIGVHYVADVAAGLLLAGLTLAVAPPFSRWLGRGFSAPG
ncbi:phosphatase PAP2 family protein [Geothrix fuzhouensis]|uniref:phosphatase PAP2 family protein n=1 Tax=Geothrix fuzhouensis TaxID=2966451 RepID=UPI002147BD2A|nr:phosphatase PAP2 family protein [Geothrix fuzhouensis]